MSTHATKSGGDASKRCQKEGDAWGDTTNPQTGVLQTDHHHCTRHKDATVRQQLWCFHRQLDRVTYHFFHHRASRKRRTQTWQLLCKRTPNFGGGAFGERRTTVPSAVVLWRNGSKALERFGATVGWRTRSSEPGTIGPSARSGRCVEGLLWGGAGDDGVEPGTRCLLFALLANWCSRLLGWGRRLRPSGSLLAHAMFLFGVELKLRFTSMSVDQGSPCVCVIHKCGGRPGASGGRRHHKRRQFGRLV